MSTGPGEQCPEASVIIACYNATDTLPKQLEALSRQEKAPAFEVILSDNGSDDNLIALADEWADRLDVHYVWSGQMPGAAYARNVGMSIARADKWLFCDADDVVASDWVEHGSAALDVMPVFSGGAIHATDAELHGPLEQIWARLDSKLHLFEPKAVEGPAAWPILMGGNFGMRRTVARDVGGFDAAMVRGAEDNDLAIRLESAGNFVAEGGTRIVYRKRDDPADALQRAFIAGQWHMALVERHGVAARSPQLRGRRWMADPIRVVGAILKNSARGRRGDWPAVRSRAGLAAGLWYGWLQYRVRHELPASLIGTGLRDKELDQPAGAAVLVLSPHLDDALFSCSELIRQTRPEVWTVFAGDPSPAVSTSWDRSCGFRDSHTLVTQRRREDLDAFEGTGAKVRHLDMLDGAYTTQTRRRADLSNLAEEVRHWLADHADQHPVIVLPACAGVTTPPSALDRVVSVAKRVKQKADHDNGGVNSAAGESGADEREAPSSVGGSATATPPSIRARAIRGLKELKHRAYQRRRSQAQRNGLAANPDHVAVRDTVLDVVDEDSSWRYVRVICAEDLPYLWSQTADQEVERMAHHLGAVAQLREFHVDRRWKFDKIANYESQLAVMDPVHRRFGRAETIPPVERCWEMVRR